MCDEVTWVRIASVLLMVDGTGANIWRAVIVDDNLIYGEYSEGSGYPAWGCDSLVGGFETGICQYRHSHPKLKVGLRSLSDDTARYGDRHRVLATSCWLKSSAWFERVDIAAIIPIVKSPFLLLVSDIPRRWMIDDGNQAIGPFQSQLAQVQGRRGNT